MDWFDDFSEWLGSEGGSDASAALADSGGDYSWDDYFFGADDAFDGGGGDSGLNGFDGTAGFNTPNEVTVSNDPEAGYDNWKPTGAAAAAGQPKSMWDSASDFLGDKKNDTMIKLGTSLGSNVIGSYQKGKAEEKAEQKLQELRAYNDKVQKEKEDRADARSKGGGGSSQLEMLAAKDAIDQANKARYSASVSGLRPTGLINSKKKLTYVGGKPVYTDAGQLAQ